MVGSKELGVYLPVCFSLSRKTREGEVKSRHFLPTPAPWGCRQRGPQLWSGEEVGGYNSLFCPRKQVCPAHVSQQRPAR